MQIQIRPRVAAKFLVNLVVGIGINRVVSGVIDNNTPDPENRTQQVTTKAAGVVAGMMAVEKTRRWTDRKIDEIADGALEIVAEIKKKQQEAAQK